MSYNKLSLNSNNFISTLESNGSEFSPADTETYNIDPHLIDGDGTTSALWLSSPNSFYLTYTFDNSEGKQHLGKLHLKQKNGQSCAFTIQVSTDGINYNTLHTETENDTLSFDLLINTPQVKYRSFRFLFSNYVHGTYLNLFSLDAYIIPQLKDYNVEFDDALLDLDGWKNPRYDGSKLTGQKINEYNNGDVTYGKNPVITNKTVALYIGNTLIGGEDEEEQYAYIKKHSYIDINRILIINPETDELTLLDATQEGFKPFHRFVTNDLPTGGSFNIRLLDYSIPNSLNANTQNYVKMNKGWLLKSFKSGVYTGNNNGLVLFNSESILKFSYALDGITGNNLDHHPTYLSASLHSNKFSDSYYSGSLALKSGTDSNTTLEFISSSDFIDQSKEYLSNNSSTTELHLTL